MYVCYEYQLRMRMTPWSGSTKITKTRTWLEYLFLPGSCLADVYASNKS